MKKTLFFTLAACSVLFCGCFLLTGQNQPQKTTVTVKAETNGHVYLVRLKGTVVPEFVVTILTGEAYRRYIRKVCVGGIDKRQINVDQVEDFPIIVPPYEQQTQFASFLSQVDKSKFVIQQSLIVTQKLLDSLMQQYFG